MNFFNHIAGFLGGIFNVSGPGSTLFNGGVGSIHFHDDLINNLFDFGGKGSGAVRQAFDFFGYHRKALAGGASPGRFNTGIQGQQICLPGNILDIVDKFTDLFGGTIQLGIDTRSLLDPIDEIQQQIGDAFDGSSIFVEHIN